MALTSVDLRNVVVASTEIVNQLVLPQIESHVRNQGIELKQKMTTEMEEKFADEKQKMEEKFTIEKQNMQQGIKSDLQHEVVVAATEIVNRIVVPHMTNLLTKFEVEKQKMTTQFETEKRGLEIKFEEEKRKMVTQFETEKEKLEAKMEKIEEKFDEEKRTLASNLQQKEQDLESHLETEIETKVDSQKQSLQTELQQDITTKIIAQQSIIQQQLLDEMNAKVIFGAIRDHSSGDVSPGATITFDKLVTNYKDAMDISSGKFTAPKKGVYLFSVSAVSSNIEGYVKIQVTKNDNKLFWIDDGEGGNTPNGKQRNIAYVWMSELNSDDTIHLQIFSGSGYVGLHVCNDDFVHFTGQLLKTND